MMRVFVTGSVNGQLHWELARTAPETMQWLSLPERLDISDGPQVAAALQELKPDVIINAAAYTAVDRAESEAEQAFLLNQKAVEYLADAAQSIAAQLIHVSTDFVFGAGDGRPFQTNAAVQPASIYGQSKLRGEAAVQAMDEDRGLVVRTSWLYSSHGSNFVKTMIRLMNERDQLGVVCDQVGAPTWAHGLAVALWQAAQKKLSGTLHWSGAGAASWYDFAVAIGEEAKALGIIDSIPQIDALTTEQYPTPAARPSYSVLALHESWERLELRAEHWRSELRKMLTELQ